MQKNWLIHKKLSLHGLKKVEYAFKSGETPLDWLCSRALGLGAFPGLFVAQIAF